MKRLALLCAIAMVAACSSGKEPTKTDVTGGITDKEQRLMRVAGATRSAGDVEGAKSIYRQVVQQSKKSVLGHLELASILNSEKKSLEALEVLTNAEELQPDNVEVLRELANTMLNMDRPTDALETIDKAIKHSADDPRLFNTRGIALDMLDKREVAQEAYKKGIALAPEKTGYIENNLAMSYIISRKLGEAISVLNRLAESPQATPTIRQNLAMAYGLAGNPDKSLEWSLKDLTPEQADQNQKIYEKLALATPAFTMPDTSVKPVTVVDTPLPEKLPELTEQQKEDLKSALKFMQEGKKDAASTIATAKPMADLPVKSETSTSSIGEEEDVIEPVEAVDTTKQTQSTKAVPEENPAPATASAEAVKDAEPAAGEAKKSVVAPVPKVVGKQETAKTTGNVFTKKLPDVPSWSWKK